MRSLTYKNLIWKTTWYKKNGTCSKPEEKTVDAPEMKSVETAKDATRRLDRLQANHWARGVKHGWNKV